MVECSVAMIDVPWAYEPDDDSPERGVLDYPTLSIQQACDLDIDPIMHKDSIIFAWVTNFVLVRGLHLEPLTAWGCFAPKTVITWPKPRHTCKAHWLRGQTEHLVMAVRGNPVVDLTDPNLSTLLKGPFHLVRKGKHSAKPREAYSFVERLAPASRYADIFSRYRRRKMGLSWRSSADAHREEGGCRIRLRGRSGHRPRRRKHLARRYTSSGDEMHGPYHGARSQGTAG